jgi:hypothetical protein
VPLETAVSFDIFSTRPSNFFVSLFELAFRYATPMRTLPNRWALVVGYLALSYFMACNSECHLAKNFMENLVDMHRCSFA